MKRHYFDDWNRLKTGCGGRVLERDSLKGTGKLSWARDSSPEPRINHEGTVGGEGWSQDWVTSSWDWAPLNRNCGRQGRDINIYCTSLSLRL